MTSRCLLSGHGVCQVATCSVADLPASVVMSDPQSMSHQMLLYCLRRWPETKTTLEYCLGQK